MSLALTAPSLPLLPSFRRQQLLLEFSSLKHHCPDGIYLAPNTNDAACWSGVFFVREGPYASAILRFELLFPPSYPEAAPLLIFSTDIFHPLLVPLTTYTFSPGAVDPTATYSASETERLPPGAFSLRYRFPQWFPTVERGRTGVRASHGSRAEDGSVQAPHNDEHSGLEPNNADDVRQPTTAITITLLQYVKSAFENPEVLDDLPLDAAGNPNAWHAWRSHRGLSKAAGRSVSPTGAKPARAGASPRNPADWNWDGVWEARVRNGIEESTSDALLFGGKNARTGQNLADPIKFTKSDDERLAGVQEDMLRMHGFSTVIARK